MNNWTKLLLESDPEIRDGQAGGEAIVVLGKLVEAICNITDKRFIQPTETEQTLLTIYKTAARAIFEYLESRQQGFFRDTQYFEPGTEEAIKSAFEGD